MDKPELAPRTGVQEVALSTKEKGIDGAALAPEEKKEFEERPSIDYLADPSTPSIPLLVKGKLHPRAKDAFTEMFTFAANKRAVHAKLEKIAFLTGLHQPATPSTAPVEESAILTHFAKSSIYEKNMLPLIFGFHESNDSMDRGLMRAYIVHCGAGDASTNDVRIDAIFTQFGEEGGKYLSLRSFLEFYQQACEDRAEAVWMDLKLFGFSKTLHKLTEDEKKQVEERKAFHKQKKQDEDVKAVKALGFTDDEKLLRDMLQNANGSVETVVGWLMGEAPPTAWSAPSWSIPGGVGGGGGRGRIGPLLPPAVPTGTTPVVPSIDLTLALAPAPTTTTTTTRLAPGAGLPVEPGASTVPVPAVGPVGWPFPRAPTGWEDDEDDRIRMRYDFARKDKKVVLGQVPTFPGSAPGPGAGSTVTFPEERERGELSCTP